MGFILFTQISELMGIGIGKFQVSVNRHRQSFGYRQKDLVSAHHYGEGQYHSMENLLVSLMTSISVRE